MGVSVFIKKIKIPLSKFFAQINEGKTNEIGLDNLNCLKKILPDKNELTEIQEYLKENPDLSQLAREDQFIKLLIDIPFYELKINLMLFEDEFNESFAKFEIPFKIYASCSQVLLTNESLKSFLAIVLASGNFINAKSYNGNATGFKMNILTKLNEVKTNTASISLLHVLVEQFDNNNIKNDFTDELSDLGLIIK
jgi:inverted formin-2